MIDPTSVAFDIDGVVADTMRLFLKIARKEFNLNNIAYEDIDSYSLETSLDIEQSTINTIIQRIMDGDYSYPLKALPGSVEVLSRLGRDYGPVIFVTARPYVGPIQDWILNVLGTTPESIEVHVTGNYDGKVDVLNQKKISHFIEDRLETCFTLQRAGIEPILFRQPWNRQAHPFIEVGDWRELEALIEFNDAG